MNFWLGLIPAAKGEFGPAAASLEVARQQRLSFGFQLDNPVILQALAICYADVAPSDGTPLEGRSRATSRCVSAARAVSSASVDSKEGASNCP